MATLKWIRRKGEKGVMAPISYGSDHHYVISHRPKQHVLCYRPPIEHHHVGEFTSEAEAKAAAGRHAEAVAAKAS